MNCIVIYGSNYGTTAKYAVELAKRLDCQAISYDEIDDHNVSKYQVVIHLGGLYAGGVLGLNDTVKQLQSSQQLLIGTVGLADVTVQTNLDSINASLRRQIPQEVYEHAKFYYLRGGIDYRKLSFKHRTMMLFLVNKVKKVPVEMRSSEEKEFIDTYQQVVDLVDFTYLDPIVQTIHQIG